MKNDMLEPVLQYGLLKERMAALYTDGIRAENSGKSRVPHPDPGIYRHGTYTEKCADPGGKRRKRQEKRKKIAGNDGFPACGEYAGKRDRYSDVNGPGHRKWTSDPADLPNDNRMGVFIGQCLSGFWPGKRPGTDGSNTDPFENLKMRVLITF